MKQCFINERLVPFARDETALIAYPHAQRTGGGTLRKHVFAASLGEARVYNRHHVPNFKHWRDLSDTDLLPYRVYTDLDDYRDTGLKRRILWIASLRHPLYRAVSIYVWVKRQASHPYHARAAVQSLEDFHREAARKYPAYFRNVQCKRICGEENAGAALELIREKYIGVGFTEHLPEFASALADVFGWPPIELGHRHNDAERYDAMMTAAFRDNVLAQNAEDAKLFEAMRMVCASTSGEFPQLEPPRPGAMRRPGFVSRVLSRFR